MGIMIRPGEGAAAKHELWCFIAAFPVNMVREKDDVTFYFLPAGRENEAEMFKDMVFNEYLGECSLEDLMS